MLNCFQLLLRYQLFLNNLCLKYLNQLFDVNIDVALVVANPTIESISLAQRINEYSMKYAIGGQMGVIINKSGSGDIEAVSSFAKEADMSILGTIPYDVNLANGSITRDSDIVTEALLNLYSRLNLPQENA